MSKYFDSLERRARARNSSVRPASSSVPKWKPLLAATPPRDRDVQMLAGPYRTLRERLLASANGRPLKKLVFASCRGGEGCTHVTREFAEALADAGLSVLLVDADLHTAGLTVATGATGSDLDQVVRGSATPLTSADGRLTIVPSPGAGRAKERFFHAPEFAAWLDMQASEYDYVLLDAPPLLEFADGALLGRLCDGAVIVVRGELTEKTALTRARDQLENSGVMVLGVIFNGERDSIPARLKPYLSGD